MIYTGSNGIEHVFKRHKTLRVLVSLVTLTVFTATSVISDASWAVTISDAFPGHEAARSYGPGETKEFNMDTFTLPAFLGMVKEQYNAGDGSKTVIHIQDAHCNYAAQKRIAQIIAYFNEEYGINSVNLEGGAGDYDLSIFTDIESKIVREKVADHFVKEGLVSGAEYFAINAPEKASLWGIEDTKLYIDKLNIYRGSLKYKDEVDDHLDALTHVLYDLKTKIYSPELLELDNKYSLYKSETLGLKDYLAHLMRIAEKKAIDIKGFTNIYLLKRILAKEMKIDFKKANVQRNVLIDNLQKKLSQRSLEHLTRKTVEFRAERISQKEFHTVLAYKAGLVGIELEDFPDLWRYIVYISMYEVIDKIAIRDEMENLGDAIKATLYQNDEQKELNELSKNLEILKGLFNIMLTPEEYRYYVDNEQAFSMSVFASFINREAPFHKVTTQLDKNTTDIDRYRDSISKFYKYSFERDRVFLKNMEFGQDRKTAIVVTGGFHAENLCDLLRKKNISYISIMPNFTNRDGYQGPYFNILSGKGTALDAPLNTLLASSLATPSIFTALHAQVEGERSFARFRVKVAAMDKMLSADERAVRLTYNGRFVAVKLGPDGNLKIADGEEAAGVRPELDITPFISTKALLPPPSVNTDETGTPPEARAGSWFANQGWVKHAWWAETGISFGIGGILGYGILYGSLAGVGLQGLAHLGGLAGLALAPPVIFKVMHRFNPAHDRKLVNRLTAAKNIVSLTAVLSIALGSIPLAFTAIALTSGIMLYHRPKDPNDIAARLLDSMPQLPRSEKEISRFLEDLYSATLSVADDIPGLSTNEDRRALKNIMHGIYQGLKEKALRDDDKIALDEAWQKIEEIFAGEKYTAYRAEVGNMDKEKNKKVFGQFLPSRSESMDTVAMHYDDLIRLVRDKIGTDGDAIWIARDGGILFLIRALARMHEKRPGGEGVRPLDAIALISRKSLGTGHAGKMSGKRPADQAAEVLEAIYESSYTAKVNVPQDWEIIAKNIKSNLNDTEVGRDKLYEVGRRASRSSTPETFDDTFYHMLFYFTEEGTRHLIREQMSEEIFFSRYDAFLTGEADASLIERLPPGMRKNYHSKIEPAISAIEEQMEDVIEQTVARLRDPDNEREIHIIDGGLKGTYCVLLKYLILKRLMKETGLSLKDALQAVERVRPHILFAGEARDRIPAFLLKYERHNDAGRDGFDDHEASNYNLLENMEQLIEVENAAEDHQPLSSRIRLTDGGTQLMAYFNALVISALVKDQFAAPAGKREDLVSGFGVEKNEDGSIRSLFWEGGVYMPEKARKMYFLGVADSAQALFIEYDDNNIIISLRSSEKEGAASVVHSWKMQPFDEKVVPHVAPNNAQVDAGRDRYMEYISHDNDLCVNYGGKYIPSGSISEVVDMVREAFDVDNVGTGRRDVPVIRKIAVTDDRLKIKYEHSSAPQAEFGLINLWYERLPFQGDSDFIDAYYDLCAHLFEDIGKRNEFEKMWKRFKDIRHLFAGYNFSEFPRVAIGLQYAPLVTIEELRAKAEREGSLSDDDVDQAVEEIERIYRELDERQPDRSGSRTEEYNFAAFAGPAGKMQAMLPAISSAKVPGDANANNPRNRTGAVIKGAQPEPQLQGIRPDSGYKGLTVNFHTLDPDVHQGEMFEVNGRRVFALRAPGDGNTIDIYVTAATMGRLKRNDSMRTALIEHEVRDEGQDAGEGSHRWAWQEVKRVNDGKYRDGMMQFIKFAIDAMYPEDVLALLKEYENDNAGRGEGRIQSGEWDAPGTENGFENEIYNYCKEVVAAQLPAKGVRSIEARTESIRAGIKNLQDRWFLRDHRIQPVLSRIMKFLNLKDYRGAWEELETALDIAYQDYNIFGLSQFGINYDEGVRDAAAPLRDHYAPVKIIQDIRGELGMIAGSTGQRVMPVWTGPDALREAADFARRYSGEPDRYDPETLRPETVTRHGFTRTTINVWDLLIAEKRATGVPASLRYLEEVLGHLEVVDGKPVLRAASREKLRELDAESAASITQERAPSEDQKGKTERMIDGAVKDIKIVFTMTRDKFIDFQIDNRDRPRKDIPDLYTIAEIARRALVGNDFLSSEEDLLARLRYLFADFTAAAMISMIKMDNGQITPDPEAQIRIFADPGAFREEINARFDDTDEGVSSAKMPGGTVKTRGKGDSVEVRNDITITALRNEENSKSRDPIAVVGLPWWIHEQLMGEYIDPDAYLAALERDRSRAFGRAGYGDPTNVHKFKFFFIEKDTNATEDNLRKALDAINNANAQLGPQEVVIFMPHMNGVSPEIGEDFFRGRFGDGYVVIPDGYSDIDTVRTNGFPAVDVRFAIARLIAWCKEAEARNNGDAQKAALKTLTAYLNGISEKPIEAITDLKDLLDQISKNLLRIKKVNYSDITDWRKNYEAVARAL